MKNLNEMSAEELKAHINEAQKRLQEASCPIPLELLEELNQEWKSIYDRCETATFPVTVTVEAHFKMGFYWGSQEIYVSEGYRHNMPFIEHDGEIDEDELQVLAPVFSEKKNEMMKVGNKFMEKLNTIAEQHGTSAREILQRLKF